MSNIYLKVTIEMLSKILFSGFNLSPGQFWGAPTHVDIIKFQNFLLQPKNERSGSKLCVAFLLF